MNKRNFVSVTIGASSFSVAAFFYKKGVHLHPFVRRFVTTGIAFSPIMFRFWSTKVFDGSCEISQSVPLMIATPLLLPLEASSDCDYNEMNMSFYYWILSNFLYFSFVYCGRGIQYAITGK